MSEIATRGQTRVPPSNLRAEESVLGAMLLSREAIAEVVETLDPDHFYKPAHGHIYDAMMGLYGGGEPVDAVTVAEELTRAGLLDEIGGIELLVDLQASTPAIGNAVHYAKIVEDHALLRRLILVSNEIAEMGYSMPDDVIKAIDEAEAKMFEVAQRRVTNTTAQIKELLSSNLDRLEQLYERGDSITGISTGYLDLDEMLAGLQPNAFYVIGARPAMGKTAFALGMAANAAMKDNKPVLVFSLEMSQLELSQRILCSEALVDSSRVRTGKIGEAEWSRISHAVGRLAEAPIYIDDNPHTSVMEIRAKSRRLKSRVGEVGVVIVDYIQLMSGRANAESRQVEVSEISRGLKILARELEAPVVALAQLNRGLEQRVDKRPMLSDLRESGCMPAGTRLLRADGTEVTLGELMLSQATPDVWSIDERGSVVQRRLVKTFPSGIKPVFRLKLASGRELEATGNHKFLTVDGWRSLDELTPGDDLATPRVLPEPRERVEWPEAEVVLLAHLLGDGSVVSSVKYASIDEANSEAVCAAVRHFGCEATLEGAGSAKRTGTIQVWVPAGRQLTHGAHHPIRDWLEPLGVWGKRSHEKAIPEEVQQLSTKQVGLFLHHLWATGGSITLSKNGRGRTVRCYYATTSQELARGVQRLLLRFEIRSTISLAKKSGHRPSYHVQVQGKPDLLRFMSEIGCHGERGRSVVDAMEILDGIKENPNNDLVDIATSDLCWDEIVEIEPLGEQPVFDATVDGTHNFIANGVVAHNSLEQDADVVMFLYRDEVYDEQSPDKGVAEVIVAKHRNGPVGRVKLAFRGQYTRFDNMAKFAGAPPPPDGQAPQSSDFAEGANGAEEPEEDF